MTWWLSFRLGFTTDSEPRDFTTAVLSLLLLLLLPDNSCSFVPLRSLISETCSRASPVSRLRSQDDSGQTWLLFCQESPAWFSLWGPPATLSGHSHFCGDRTSLALSARFQELSSEHMPELSGQRPAPCLSGLHVAREGATGVFSRAPP